jgi:hypothetical protein
LKKTIFYSWQSDLPGGVNRNFIWDALENAAKVVAKDDTIDVELALDRDTAGVPGSPDIATTIFGKIDAADLVVLDVSLITPEETARRSPNPNVLIELGYAVRSKSWQNVVLVMNRAYGRPEQLPFDLRSRRATVYELHEGADETDRRRQKDILTRILEIAIRAALEHQAATVGEVIEPIRSEAKAIEAIEGGKANRGRTVSRFTSEVFDDVSGRDPNLAQYGQTTYPQVLTPLLAALEGTEPIVAEYGRVANAAADMKDGESLVVLYRGLEQFAVRYDHQYGAGGVVLDYEYDFWRFVGLDLVLTLVAVCVRTDFWEGLAEILSHDLLLRTVAGGPATKPFTYHNRGIVTIERCSEQLKSWFPVGQILKDRHDRAPLKDIADFESIAAADLFLFMRSEIRSDQPHEYPKWRVTTPQLSEGPPEFLFRAARIGIARRLASAVGVDRPEVLRERLWDRGRELLYKGHAGLAIVHARNPLTDVVHEIGGKP